MTNVFDVRDKLHGIRYLFGLMLCITGICLSAMASPSDLDPAFGTLGMVVSAPNGTPTFTSSGMARQTDGKIVIVGNRVQSGQYAGMFVARYNADGSLDTTFGTGGFSSVSFGAFFEFAESVDVAPDGKIVIGGTIRTNMSGSPAYEFAIVRFNTNGSLDTTFDGDGKVTVDFSSLIGGFYQETLSTIKVASDGKIVAAGSALDPGVADRFILARINPDGSPDTTFGTNGRVADITQASNHDRLGDMVILPDGKIVIVGFHWGLGGSRRRACKFSAAGVKEWEYNEGVFGSTAPQTEVLNGVAALPDGKVIVVGKRGGKIAAIRLNTNGTEDNTFINAMPDGMAQDVAIDAFGKIVATLSSNEFSLVRWNANGSLDTSFGSGGYVTTSLTSGGDYTAELLIQPDGKILVGGTSQPGNPTEYYISMARYLGGNAIAYKTLFDFDGDRKADVSIFRPSENKWYILRSFDSVLWQPVFAITGDVPVPADYDGDQITDIAIFRPSTGDWWSRSSINGSQVYAHWGANGDLPRPSDFDGDGRADYVVFRPSNNFWYRISSANGASSNVAFGLTGDKPVTGDFDGDGKTDVAIYRPATGDWWWQSSIDNVQRATHWGISTDIPAAADYDADGKTDFAVYRPSTGTWYIYNSATSSSTILNFGLAEDKPVAADYDGDGKADIAVFRPSTGVWYLMRSTAGFAASQFGASTDIPTPNVFVP
jgi:uncharacterized delta-60 repeat protein